MKKIISAITIIPIIIAFGYNSSNYKDLNENVKLGEKIVLKDFEAGDFHSGITIDTDENGYADTLYMWGRNDKGQIGNATAINQFYPIKILPQNQNDWGGNIIDFSLNGLTSGLTVDTNLDGYADTLYMWGNNSKGEIGDGTIKNTTTPKIITPTDQTNWGGNIIDFDLGYNHTGVTIDTNLDGYADTLYMWGSNQYGQIGNNGTTGTGYYSSPQIINPESGTWGGNIVDLDLGYNHTGVTIDTDSINDGYGNVLYMWGNNSNGQIGNETTGGFSTTPIIVVPQSGTWNGTFIDFELNGDDSSLLINENLEDPSRTNNTLYMWGNNQYGQIGNGTEIDVSTPTIITPENNDWGGSIYDVSLGGNYSSVVVNTNEENNEQYADTLYMWGNNQYGQLGNGTITNLLTPTMITPKNDQWQGKITDISLGNGHSGILIDYNNDSIADTLYMAGNDAYGQLGNGGNASDANLLEFEAIFSTIPNILNNYQFYYLNNKLFVQLNLNDALNVINDIPSIKIKDNNGKIYNTTFIDGRSNIEEDSYYYRIDGDFIRGEEYTIDSIIIDGYEINIEDYSILTDYIISDYWVSIINSTDATISLNLTQNGEAFDINNYTNDQRQVKINYTNLDLNTTYHKKVTLDDSYKIKLNNLSIDTNYQITSIQYFYEDGNYKYKIEQDPMNFITKSQNPSIIANSFGVINYSITNNSFNYSVEIDNLKPNADETGFENYDVNNGIWLIDQNNNYYNSTYLDSNLIGYSSIAGYYDYEFIFQQNGLNLENNNTYIFTGLSLDNPFYTENPEIVYFDEPITVESSENSEISLITDSFVIFENSITSNSFEFSIQIDNLKLKDNSNINNPTFNNFNPYNGIFLKDDSNKYYQSDYIENSAIYIGKGSIEGTEKYQFTFKVNNLIPNTEYTFIEISTINYEDYYQSITPTTVRTDSI